VKSKLSIRLSIRIRRLEHCAPPPLRQCRRLLRPRPPQRRPSVEAYRRSGASWRGPYAAFLQNATLPHTHTRGCTPGWYAVPRWGTQLNHRRPYLARLKQPPMNYQRPYLGLVGQPQWIVDGFISAWWGNPLELSTALFRLVEALLSAAWGQAVCAGWAGFGGRLLGGTGCCGRTPNVLGTPCCLGTGCVCEMDRFWGQAAGRTPNLLGTGCWELGGLSLR